MAPPEESLDDVVQSLSLDANDPVFESVERLTAAQFERFAGLCEERGDIHHYELLNRRIVMTPPAGFPHGAIEIKLAARIQNFVEAAGNGQAFGSSQGFTVSSDDVVQPDVSVVSSERWAALALPIPAGFLHVVPNLVVEILSPRTASYDRGEKREIYARVGVEEYWIVDHLSARVTISFLENGAFGEPVVVEQDGEIVSRFLSGLRIPVRDIFSR